MTLTRTDIEDIMGPVDDHFAALLAATGATPAELTRALTWYNADDAAMRDGGEMPKGRVAELIAVLETADGRDQDEL